MPHRNVLFLIADDLGKYVGCYGCPSVRTPNLDKLASSGGGIRFDMAFASTASCSGSRSTIYTGMHTHENGQYGLNIFRTHFQTFPHILSAPRIFKDAGYKTGIIGKIHVGPDSVYPWEHKQEAETRDVAWVADQAEAFFSTSKGENRAFHLTVGFVDPHRDVTTRGEFGNDFEFDPRVKRIELDAQDVEVPTWLPDLPEVRQELVEYYKAIHRTDQGVGLILEALERQGLANDTLVVFTSDNGPPFINAKTTLYDAGTCLPLIVRHPELTKSFVNPNMISFIDLLPTFIDWAGIHLSNGSSAEDAMSQPVGQAGFTFEFGESPPRRGRSFLPILTREDVVKNWQHEVFGSHTFHELHQYWPTRVLRTRRYKYHRNIAWRLDFPIATDLYASYTFAGIRREATEDDGEPKIGSRSLRKYLFRPSEELFDLETDPDELRNLALDAEADKDIKRVLDQMRLKLEAWQRQTKDPWLYRDGQSMMMLERYKGEGMWVPNRFDIGGKLKDVKMVEMDAVAREQPSAS